MHCAEAWKRSVAVVSAGKPSAVEQRIIGRQRKPVGRPDRRRLANYSRLRRVGENCATQSIPFARQVAASRARFPRMRFLVMGHVLARADSLASAALCRQMSDCNDML